uniref:protein FAM185A isoform X2 n=1 Tax=Myxine glutinosa TaxID=7769 RepID=UPI00358EF176
MVPLRALALRAGVRIHRQLGSPRVSQPRRFVWEGDANRLRALYVRTALGVSVRPPPDLHSSDAKHTVRVRLVRSALRHVVETCPQGLRLCVRMDSDGADGSGTCTSVGGPSDKSGVHINWPGKFDVDIATTGAGSVDVEEVDSHDIRVQTQEGQIHLVHVKGAEILLRSSSGSIRGEKAIIGSSTIQTDHQGDVEVDKLQGERLQVASGSGRVSIRSLYCETANLSARAGDIRLGSIHGSVSIRSEGGNVSIGSVDGDVQVLCAAGNIAVHLSRPTSVNLTSSEGDVTIGFPESLGLDVRLSMSHLDLGVDVSLQDQSITSKDGKQHVTGRVNGGGVGLWAKAGGILRLHKQSWFQSLSTQH